MTQKKFYVVWKGRKPGIYSDWQACSAQVNTFPGARYKAFETRLEAERAFKATYTDYSGRPASSQKWLFAPHPPEADSLVVDAACSGSPGRLEWRGLHLSSGKQLFHAGPFEHGTNNVGEFLAIIQALLWMEQKGRYLPIYSDSGTAIAWIRRGRCNTALKPGARNRALFDLIRQADAWLQAHPGRPAILKWDTRLWGENPADFNRK